MENVLNAKKLLQHFKSAKAVYEADKKDILEVTRIQTKGIQEIIDKKGYKKAIITLKKGQNIDLTTGI